MMLIESFDLVILISIYTEGRKAETSCRQQQRLDTEGSVGKENEAAPRGTSPSFRSSEFTPSCYYHLILSTYLGTLSQL